jgi:hypothetical protein
MAFYTILTDIGKAKLANATALGSVVSLTEIAVGDGGGVAVTPEITDTALTNEVWRAALNNISIDSSNANWIVAEGYIPSTDGDFTVREVGLFDVDGDMIAVGNYPDTYKPTLASGSAKDLYIKVIIEVSDAGVVELKIDPAVVLSTRKYVDDEVAKRALLQGDNTKSFKVADATLDDEALSLNQFVNIQPEIKTNVTIGGGNNLNLIAPAGSTDSGDVVFYNGDGTERGRLYHSNASGLMQVDNSPIWYGQKAEVNKVQNGYQILPSGLIIQWGHSNSSSNGERNTFPIAFPNACFIVLDEHNGTATNTSSTANSADATGYTSYNEYGTTIIGMNYIAIGY